MERIVIIDHETHQAFIEEVSDEVLAKYAGEEEKYIEDNYELSDNWSWDYVTAAYFIPKEEDPIDIFEELE